MVTRQPADVEPDHVVALTPLIRRVLRTRLADQDLVEDLTQDCLTQLLDARHRLSPDTLAGYAIITARNTAISHGRRHERRQRHLPRLIDLRAPDDPADEVVRSEEVAALRAALGRLPTPDLDALIAHDVHDVDNATLAADAKTTPGNVASRLNRTRGKLRVEYVLAAQGTSLPSPRCRAVLLALSNADQRRQTALAAGDHLAECATCATLSVPLVERRRSALLLLPVSIIISRLLRPLGRWTRTHSAHTAVGTAVTAAVAVTVAVASNSPPTPVATTPTPVVTSGPPTSLNTGTLTADAGTSLLGLGTGNRAQPEVGQTVTGTNIVVQPPLDLKDGFWVGDSPTDSYFVDLADSLTTIPTGPVVQLNQTQTVSFTGQLVANTPEYLDEARSDGIPGFDKLAAQGYHIAATPDHVHP